MTTAAIQKRANILVFNMDKFDKERFLQGDGETIAEMYGEILDADLESLVCDLIIAEEFTS